MYVYIYIYIYIYKHLSHLYIFIKYNTGKQCYTVGIVMCQTGKLCKGMSSNAGKATASNSQHLYIYKHLSHLYIFIKYNTGKQCYTVGIVMCQTGKLCKGMSSNAGKATASNSQHL